MSEQPQQQAGQKVLSGLVFVLSFGVVVAVGVATSAWYDVVFVQPDTWGALIFRIVASIVAGSSIVLVVAPSAFLYSRKHRRLDLVSLCIASIALLVLFAEFVVLFFIPLKPGSPAG